MSTTSRRSPPRRSSGSSRLAVLAAVALSFPGLGAARGASAQRDADGPLRETRGGVTVDWGEGTLASSGGAAADLRMPSADLARPGSVRRAREAALAKLRQVLAELPLGGGRTLPGAAIDRALERARTSAVEYESNGGARTQVTVRFSDWIDGEAPAPGSAAPAPVATLVVPAMHLAAAPEVKISEKAGGKTVSREAAVGAARYRVGPPPAAAGALAARVDKGGHVVIEGDRGLGEKLARGLVVIYVQKVLR